MSLELESQTPRINGGGAGSCAHFSSVLEIGEKPRFSGQTADAKHFRRLHRFPSVLLDSSRVDPVCGGILEAPGHCSRRSRPIVAAVAGSWTLRSAPGDRPGIAGPHVTGHMPGARVPPRNLSTDHRPPPGRERSRTHKRLATSLRSTPDGPVTSP